MSNDRPWYLEPETFIAFAALVVSVSAVGIGLYEAMLQRRHDRAEVWPHVEISTYTTPTTASVYLENNGIGPAVVRSIVVTVDSQPKKNWDDVLVALVKSKPQEYGRETVGDRAVRAGDRIALIQVPLKYLPDGFWDYVHRVGVTVCYASVFGDEWQLTTQLGSKETWRETDSCSPAAPGTDF